MSAWASKARCGGGEDRRTVPELSKFPSLHSSDENGRRSEAGFLYTMTQLLHITPRLAESPHLQCGKTTPLYITACTMTY
ncbi:unnamed protein product [Pleuronectes platessa]|uniref:Uncharacterized protein n=1 Tax=Pleuronectes platessa TaxID=8262 RepID=A0A9N7YLL1_PLEPL|nr:unnamed protein product [Pleuronectes platessa]